jgi:hypothetical protein
MIPYPMEQDHAPVTGEPTVRILLSPAASQLRTLTFGYADLPRRLRAAPHGL